ncbi:hypothetical protein [Oleisolibacter albus]|nr:hypothetical protein [Oleisolibacter albus]
MAADPQSVHLPQDTADTEKKSWSPPAVIVLPVIGTMGDTSANSDGIYMT